MNAAGGAGSARGVWLRFALLCAIIGGGGALALTVGLPSVDRVHETVSELGVFGVLICVLGYAGVTLLPVPASPLTVLAGVLFGLAGGAAVVLLGATLGAEGGFWLGRLLGRDAVQRLTRGRASRLDDVLGRRGLMAILGIRLVPVVPFAVVNYAAGLSSVRQGDYLVGTVIGIAPATVAYVALGAYGSSPLSWPFGLAVGALLLLTAGTAVFVRRTRKALRQTS